MKINTKGLVLIFAIVLLIVVGVFVYKNKATVPAIYTETTVAPAVNGTLTYINPRYGFSLTFPASWSNYTVAEHFGDTYPYISFARTENLQVFMILVLTPAEYEEYLTADIRPFSLVEKTPDKVFLLGVDIHNYSDAVRPYRQDVPGIMATFKLIN